MPVLRLFASRGRAGAPIGEERPALSDPDDPLGDRLRPIQIVDPESPQIGEYVTCRSISPDEHERAADAFVDFLQRQRSAPLLRESSGAIGIVMGEE